MRMHLRSTVAIAALALATPGFAQGPATRPARTASRNHRHRAARHRQDARQCRRRGPRPRTGARTRPERAQDGLRQERPDRQPERSAQPGRPADDKPDTPRPPRAAEPATPPSPSTPDRRNAESERPGRGNEARPDGQRNPRAAEPAQPAQPAQPQRDAQPNRPGDNRNGDSKTGEAGSSPPVRARPNPPLPRHPLPPNGRATLSRPDPDAGAPAATAQPSPSSTPQQPDSTAARTPATPDQQRAISETIERQVERQAVRPTRDIGVSVSVGTALPERVRIERLPREIVDVRPQYRDYGVVVTERETVIVDPRTRRVVEVIDRAAAAATTASSSSASSADPSANGAIPASISAKDVILPADAPLAELPSEYIERTPRYRGYRYVASGDESRSSSREADAWSR